MLKKEYSRIVEAVVRKAQALCPYSLELIGVYGSCATGDTHERSDLDLLILIRDEAGRCLSHAFILEDTGIGFDLYCTTWDMLERDAACAHPHLGKLMDSHILYVGNSEAPARLAAAGGDLGSDTVRHAVKYLLTVRIREVSPSRNPSTVSQAITSVTTACRSKGIPTSESSSKVRLTPLRK